jgi:hypothetical protein
MIQLCYGKYASEGWQVEETYSVRAEMKTDDAYEKR